MTWRTVARNDLVHLRRSKMGYAVATVVLLVTVGPVLGIVAIGAINGPGALPRFREVLLGIVGILAVALPLVALVASYGAIITERKMGSIRFLLGLPNSRADAYVGKFVSRSLLVGAPLVAGLLLAALIGAVAFRRPALLPAVAAIASSVAYAMIFVGLGLTLSAAVDTETRAVVGIIGVYVLFRGLWTALQWAGLELTSYGRPERPYGDWYYLLGRLNPMNAYAKVTSAAVDPSATYPLITAPESAAAAVPFATAGFAALALALWVGLAPWLGYSRFRDRDLP